MAKKNKLPPWISHFRALVRMAGHVSKEPYQKGQEALLLLMESGRGNCIAWSKLFRDVLSFYQVQEAYHMIFCLPRGKTVGHQITIVYNKDGTVWCQSNEKVRLFKNIWSAQRYGAKEMGWLKKGIKIGSYHLISNQV